MNIEYLQLPWNHRLIEDYYQNFHSSPVKSLFSYNPWDQESFRQRYQDLQQRNESIQREQLLSVFQSQYENNKPHPQVELNLKRLMDERSCVVIGGHQAGLLTGPLYTLYKAITIIQLAKQQEERLGVPVIPVFWMAGEDHDLDEVNHVWIRNHQENVRKHAFLHNLSTTNRTSVSNLALDPSLMLKWLDELSQHLPDTPYKMEWLEECGQILSSSLSWGEHFFKLMQRFFQPWGLLLIDSTNLDLRRLERPFFIRLIKENRLLRESVFETEQKLRANHYHQPVKLEENHAQLFIHLQGERFPLFNHHDRWMTRDGTKRWTTDELLQIVEKTPEKLSNNVLTRPLMQEYLFPTLAFVGGPGEIAYWALLKDSFDRMDVPMPIVYPRIQITLVDQTSLKRMQHFQLSWKDLFLRYDQKRKEWLHHRIPLDIDQLFQQAHKAIDRVHQDLIDQLSEHINRQLPEVASKNREKIKEQLYYLRRYVEKSMEDQYQIDLRRMNELAIRLFPLKKPQERVYNVIQIWNEHGLTWLERLIEEPLLEKSKDHLLVHI